MSDFNLIKRCQIKVRSNVMKRKLGSSVFLFFYFISIIIVLFSACTTSRGTQFDETQISKIEKGKTTQAQILDLLGEPSSKGVNTDGKTQWKYEYSQLTAYFVTTSEKITKILTITFNKENVVEEFQYQESKL